MHLKFIQIICIQDQRINPPDFTAQKQL
jgi:hypothetical protein